MPIQDRPALLITVVLALGAAACGEETAPSGLESEDGMPSAAVLGPFGSAGRSIDEEFAELAREVPGFGGLFFDEAGRPTIYLTDPARLAAASRAATARLERDLAVEGAGVGLAGVRVLRGRYDFLELHRWRGELTDLLALPGVVRLDTDERRNRLVVGVADAGAHTAVERALAHLGIPGDAVVVETAASISTATTLQDRVRPIAAGLRIQSSTASSVSGFCSLGYNILRPDEPDALLFLVAAHCTSEMGVVDDTAFWQGRVGPDGNRLGLEQHDTDFFAGEGCPEGRLCRFSDAAVGRYVRKRNKVLGSIVKTKFADNLQGSIEIVEPPGVWPTTWFTAIDIRPRAMVGQQLAKIGSETGWTNGLVEATCVDANLVSPITDFTFLCQDFVDAGSGGGDSGAPVFKRAGPRFVDRIVFPYGILWGVELGAPRPRFIFSSLDNIERDLGKMFMNE